MIRYLFDFRSFSLRAVKGDIILRVSLMSSRTSAGTFPLVHAKHNKNQPMKNIDNGSLCKTQEREARVHFLTAKKMRENHPQVYKHKYILSIMIYLCEFTDLVHTSLELGM